MERALRRGAANVLHEAKRGAEGEVYQIFLVEIDEAAIYYTRVAAVLSDG